MRISIRTALKSARSVSFFSIWAQWRRRFTRARKSSAPPLNASGKSRRFRTPRCASWRSPTTGCTSPTRPNRTLILCLATTTSLLWRTSHSADSIRPNRSISDSSPNIPTSNGSPVTCSRATDQLVMWLKPSGNFHFEYLNPSGFSFKWIKLILNQLI